MRVHLLSDVHLEFGALPASFDPRALGADLHLLAGDIGVGMEGVEWALSALDAPAAYVFGNHEHYGNRALGRAISAARERCSGSHLSVLDGHELLLVPGARVLGATLWTDFELFGGGDRRKNAIDNARLRMNDYRQICLGYEEGHDEEGRPLAYRANGEKLLSNWRIALTPEETILMHRRSLDWLREKLSEPFPGKTIVLTHHAPSAQSLLYQQPGSLLDAAYASDLEDLILDHKIDLWVHGHTHVACDYMVGNTRVVSNPRGYWPSALVDGFDPGLILDI